MNRTRDFSTHPQPRGPRPVDTGLLVAALLAFALSAHAAWAAWRDLSVKRTALDEARTAADAAVSRARALESRKSPVGESLVTATLLTTEAPPPRVLADLSTILPEDVRLDGLTLTYGERLDLEMRVAARGAAAYDLLLKRFEDSPLFGDVVPGPENRDGEVLASLTMTYRGVSAR